MISFGESGFQLWGMCRRVARFASSIDCRTSTSVISHSVSKHPIPTLRSFFGQEGVVKG